MRGRLHSARSSGAPVARRLALGSLLWLGGCAGAARLVGLAPAPAATPAPAAPVSPDPRPVSLRVAFVAAPHVNPDTSGRSLPIVVRMYQLVSPTRFERADFYSLQQDAAAVLGTDLVEHRQFQLRPGQRIQTEQRLGDRARFLGWVATFHQLERANWRALSELPALAPESIRAGAQSAVEMTVEIEGLGLLARPG